MSSASQDSGDSQEARLIARLRDGDESVLVEVIRTMGQIALIALLSRFGPRLSREDCEEVVSDATFRVWEKREEYDPAKGKLRTWFYSIAEHFALDRLRSKEHKVRVKEVPLEPELVADTSGGRENSEVSAERIELARIVGEIVNELPSADRRIITQYYHLGGNGPWTDGLPEELGLSVENIRVKRIRITSKIKRELVRLGHLGPKP